MLLSGHSFFLKTCFILRVFLFFFLDPRPWPEGSYNIGSVRPSVRKFSQNWLMSVFETQHGVRGPYLVMCDSRILWSEMAQKHGLWTFQDNHVFSFVWNLCKMRVLTVHQHFAKTACLGKIWFSSYSQNGSQPMRFKYSLIVNISLME